MKASPPASPFRFRDLPREIRDKIYGELSCHFKPLPTSVSLLDSFDFEPAHDGLDTAILRTSKAIHQEAYETLVKRNRFVSITTNAGVPLRMLLNGVRVPVVASGKTAVTRFRGYVLAVHLGCTKPIHPSYVEGTDVLDPCDLIILHRDLGMFCEALTDGDALTPGFSGGLQIRISMAPLLDHTRPSWYNSVNKDFFSTDVQEALLAPLRSGLRGYKLVKIEGHVNKDLARAVINDMARDKWSDPRFILADLAAAKEKGAALFKARRIDDGSLVWQDAAVEIDKIVASTSWETLVKRGDEQFIPQLAELYFLLRLNIAHVQIMNMQSPRTASIGTAMAQDALHQAVRAIAKDYWKSGYRYVPGRPLLAKLRYRHALFMRLEAVPDNKERALKYIEKALELQPGDASIIKEKQNIIAWLQRGF